MSLNNKESYSYELPHGSSLEAQRFHSPYDKILNEQNAISLIREWKIAQQTVVVTEAVFDIPHYRHADYLLACANLGDRLVVRINSDSLIASRKDPRGPIVTWANRAKHAAHYPYVDLITVKDNTSQDWLNLYRPDILVKSVTSGTEIMEELLQMIPLLNELNIKLIFMDQFANLISFEDYVKQTQDYNKDKLSSDKFSGTIIKKEMERRILDDYNHSSG